MEIWILFGAQLRNRFSFCGGAWMNDLISIIVPIYKAERYLSNCIDSILSQSYQNIQIILVDDGSPDSCPSICDRYAENEERIKVIHQANQGVSIARNIGLNMAKGSSYIGFVDSDDWVEPNMFETLLSLIKRYGAQIAMCGYMLDSDTNILRDGVAVEGVYNKIEALEHIIKVGKFNGFLCNKLFKASFFDDIKLQEDIFYCEDLLASVQCFLKADRVAYTMQPYYHYRVVDDSLTKKLTMNTLTSFKARDTIISLLPPALSSIEKAYYASSVSEMLCWAYEEKNIDAILFLKRLRKRYIKEFFSQSSLFQYRTVFKLVGTVLCPDFFCPIWNVVKKCINGA